MRILTKKQMQRALFEADCELHHVTPKQADADRDLLDDGNLLPDPHGVERQLLAQFRAIALAQMRKDARWLRSRQEPDDPTGR